MRTIVLHNPWLVESMDAELQVQRANYKVTPGFSTAQGQCPNHHVVQGSAITYTQVGEVETHAQN